MEFASMPRNGILSIEIKYIITCRIWLSGLMDAFDKWFGASDRPQLAQGRDHLRFCDHHENYKHFVILKSVISAHFGKGTKKTSIYHGKKQGKKKRILV
jgi:hypothetical protein